MLAGETRILDLMSEARSTWTISGIRPSTTGIRASRSSSRESELAGRRRARTARGCGRRSARPRRSRAARRWPQPRAPPARSAPLFAHVQLHRDPRPGHHVGPLAKVDHRGLAGEQHFAAAAAVIERGHYRAGDAGEACHRQQDRIRIEPLRDVEAGAEGSRMGRPIGGRRHLADLDRAQCAVRPDEAWRDDAALPSMIRAPAGAATLAPTATIRPRVDHDCAAFDLAGGAHGQRSARRRSRWSRPTPGAPCRRRRPSCSRPSRGTPRPTQTCTTPTTCTSIHNQQSSIQHNITIFKSSSSEIASVSSSSTIRSTV